jgi:hypothetical protein
MTMQTHNFDYRASTAKAGLFSIMMKLSRQKNAEEQTPNGSLIGKHEMHALDLDTSRDVS